jgi:hypothetical protein
VSNEYSPDSFYTSGTDKRGHDKQIRATSIEPGLHGAINLIIGSGVFPQLRITGDLVRDALHHRVKYLLDKLEDDEYVAEAKKQLEVSRLLAKAEARDNALAEQQAMVNALWAQYESPKYYGLDGTTDLHDIRDAYNSITFAEVKAEFDRRLARVGIDPTCDFDFE